jgi:hypothetical protein
MTIRPLRLEKIWTPSLIRLFTTALPLFVATSLQAIEPEDLLYYRLGSVSFRPNFGIGESYNDNVFFRGDDTFFVINPDGSTSKIERTGDFITSLTGGTSILLGKPTGNFVSANYGYSHRLFQKHSIQNAGNHSISLQGKIDGARISLTPNFTFSNTKSILNGANATATLRNQLVERNNIRGRVSTRITVSPKTFTTSTASYSVNDIKGNLPLFDQDDLSFQQGFGFQIRPKIDLSATGTIGQRSTDSNNTTVGNSSDQTYFGGGFQAEGEFTDRLLGEANFGIQRSTFSSSSESFTAPVVGISLEYLMGRDLLADISYTRSTFVGIQSANSSGVSERVGITLRKPFGTRKNWTISAAGNLNFQSWENQTGLSGNRSDEWLSGTLSLQYKIQEWLSSSFSYSLQSFSSSLAGSGTFGVVDYDVNTVSLSMRVGY